MKKRVISMILVLAMACTLFVAPVSAAYSYSRDISARDSLSESFRNASFNDSQVDFFKEIGEALDINVVDARSLRVAVDWYIIDWISSRCSSTYGDFGDVSYRSLVSICSQFDTNFNQPLAGSPFQQYLNRVAKIPLKAAVSGSIFDADIRFSLTTEVVSGTPIQRIVIWFDRGGVQDSFVLTNSDGDFWYCLGDSSDTENNYAGSGTNGNDDDGMIWVNYERAVQLAQNGGALIANESQMALYLNWAKADRGSACKYLQLASYATIGALYTAITDTHDYFLGFRDFNSDGTHTDYVIVYPAGNNWYTGTQQTVTGVTDNSDALGSSDTQLNLNLGDIMMLDALNKFVVSPDGDINFIDNVTFDMSSKTYKFADTVNYYYYDNRSYTWNYEWTYHINYTSVTYIGQSEEYDKHYEFYYELPDGRSSADLTAEELEQLNLSVDVLNYGRSTDDVDMRSLYHFDGTTHDSSFWNYVTDFTWNSGASLTYLDAGSFNGALYLDELVHDFTFTLPSYINSHDFTIQWRMYQSHTEVPALDSYVKLGDATVLQFNGSQILDSSGTVLCDMPVGSWNEIAIMRDSGTLRFYLNGVQVGTGSNTALLGPTINFHFGADQQTFKEIDEFRVLYRAIVHEGAYYQPSSVPHDTNLALVLPTSSIPVADAYWNFSSAYPALTSVINGTRYSFSCQFDFTDQTYYPFNSSSGPYFSSSYSSVGRYDDFVRLSSLSYSSNTYYFKVAPLGDAYFIAPCSGFFFPLHLNEIYNPDVTSQNYFFDGSFNVSVVHSDESISTCTLSCGDSSSFDWGAISFDLYSKRYEFYTTFSFGVTIKPNIGSPIDVVCIDIRPIDAEPFEAEYVSSVTLMDSDSLNTPTLAVRSDIPVTNYQIGGVRPSAPYKGLVYAMVESGYITSLQIYDGYAWVSCDGRIWTGSRWIPYSSYNVITLSDMYDIADASGQSGYEYIYSESGFWSWFQKQWLAFREWCNSMYALVSGLGGGSSGSSVVNDLEIDPDAADDDESAGWFVSFVKRVVKLGSRAVRGMSDAVFEDALSNVGEAVDNFSSFYSDDAVDPNEYVALLPIDDADSSDYELYGFKVYDRESVWQ